MDESERNRRDVEKRWRDPRELRAATLYCVVVGVCAVVIAAVTTATTAVRAAPAIVPDVVLLLGGIGALVQAFRVWRRGGVWPIWQGAGWFLLTLALLYAGMSSGLLTGDDR